MFAGPLLSAGHKLFRLKGQLCDEAISALDSESEQAVQDALRALLRAPITLVIAHQLSSIEHAGAICVMGAGSIVAQGPHAILLLQDGLCARLRKLQFAGQAICRPAATKPVYRTGQKQLLPDEVTGHR